MNVTLIHPGRLARDVITRLDPTYTLTYPAYDDKLTKEQIVAYLAGRNPFDDPAFEDFDSAVADAEYAAAIEIIKEVTDDHEYEALDSDPDALDEVRFAIYDRNDADMWASLLHQTPDHLFRLDLGYEVPDLGFADDATIHAEITNIANAAHLDPRNFAVRDAIHQLTAEASYGGQLYILWYGDTEDTINLAARTTGSIRFDGTVHLLILNGWNGSGSDIDIPGPVTVPIREPHAIYLDAERTGPGYSWSDVAGPWPRAYATDVAHVPPAVSLVKRTRVNLHKRHADPNASRRQATINYTKGA